MQVQTVTGPIGVDQLGLTLMHEHLFITFPGAEFDPSAIFDRADFVNEAVRRLRQQIHSILVDNPKRFFAGEALPLLNRDQRDGG